MLLAHGIGRGVAAHQNRKPFHPSSQSFTKSSTQTPAYGSSAALNGHAICSVGQPIYLWPAPGQCLVGPRLARGTKLHTPACPACLT